MAKKFNISRYMDDAILANAASLGVHPDTAASNPARSVQFSTGIRVTKLQEMLKSVTETHAKSITGSSTTAEV